MDKMVLVITLIIDIVLLVFTIGCIVTNTMVSPWTMLFLTISLSIMHLTDYLKSKY